MQVNFDPKEIEPIIAATVAATIAAIQANETKMGDKLAFSEPEAAHLLGLASHQLRDERLRGRIASTSIVGRRIRYTRPDLLAYLAAGRAEARA